MEKEFSVPVLAESIPEKLSDGHMQLSGGWVLLFPKEMSLESTHSSLRKQEKKRRKKRKEKRLTLSCV